MTVIEILNRQTVLRDQMDQAIAEERMEDARNIEGRIAELDDMMREAAEAEANAMAQAQSLAAAAPSAFAPRNFAQGILGDPHNFTGLEKGQKYRNTASSGAVVLPTPLTEETSLPGWGTLPINFAGTLAHGTCDGDVKYFRRGTRNASVGTWKPGTDQVKSQSGFTWTKDTAFVEWLATWVPIEEPTLKRYGELESIINVELSNEMDDVEDQRYLRGSDSQGIKGVLGQTGVQSYTAASGDTVVDSLRKMIQKCYLNSRLYPTAIAVTPDVAMSIDLLKDTTGHYLTLMLNGRLWNLPVVEDINLVTVTQTTKTSKTYDVTHNSAMVYYGDAATVMDCDARQVGTGLINAQYTQNQLTLRMEESKALKVTYPDAFVHCLDIIPATEVEVTE